MTRAERKVQLRKNIITTISGILVVCSLIILLGIENHIKTHYKREAIVIDYQGYDTKVEDKQGNIWVFEGSNYELGDEVVLSMYTNHTDENIYDDEIINVKIKK